MLGKRLADRFGELLELFVRLSERLDERCCKRLG